MHFSVYKDSLQSMSIKLASMRNCVIKYNHLINCCDHYYRHFRFGKMHPPKNEEE